jgi:TrmH family RNA methyltransferase
MKTISSRDNALFKKLQRLAGSSRERRKSGKALLDGMHLLDAYCQRFGAPETVVIDTSQLQSAEISAFLKSHPRIEPVLFTTALFADSAPVAAPSGIIAICDLPEAKMPQQPPETCVMLEGIQDPGNLGSILRSAAAAGITDAFLAKDCAFAWSPKTLRAGMGAHFALSIHEHADLAAVARWFGGEVIATLPDARQSLYDTDVSGRVAWLLGGEGGGLSEAAAGLASQKIAIPMANSAESLNVAAAAAICFFERLRQRDSRSTQRSTQ